MLHIQGRKKETQTICYYHVYVRSVTAPPSPFPRKRRRRILWRSPPSCFASSPAIPSQHHLLLCTPSPAPPPGSGYILEEVKAPIQGKRDRELRGDPLFVFLVLVSFLVLLVLVFLLLLLLLLTPPHPSARICVSSVVRSLTDWLLCLSVLFPPCASSALRLLFRCALRRGPVVFLASLSERSIVV